FSYKGKQYSGVLLRGDLQGIAKRTKISLVSLTEAKNALENEKQLSMVNVPRKTDLGSPRARNRRALFKVYRESGNSFPRGSLTALSKLLRVPQPTLTFVKNDMVAEGIFLPKFKNIVKRRPRR
ncbi:MAG: hypothetical protein NUV67_01520, partial [archaeon]|nr:hypothetical protein [archaeon]